MKGIYLQALELCAVALCLLGGTRASSAQNSTKISAESAINALIATEKVGSSEGVLAHFVFDLLPPQAVSDNEDNASKKSQNLFDNARVELRHERWILDEPRSFLEARTYFPEKSQAVYLRNTTGKRLSTMFSVDDKGLGRAVVSKSEGAIASIISARMAGNFGAGHFSYSSYLKEGTISLINENETVNGFKTVHIRSLIPQVGGSQQHDVWLSSDKAFREVRKDVVSRIGSTEIKEFRTRYENLSFKPYGGSWIPSKGVSLDWLVNSKGTMLLRRLEWFELIEAKPFKEQQFDAFSIPLPLGTAVSDGSGTPSIVVGGDISPYWDRARNQQIPKDIQAFVERVIADNTKATKP